MILKIILAASCLINIVSCSYARETIAAESDQQIGDFSLSGYGEKGRKAWDLSGKSANIFTDNVKLESVVGNLYGDEDVKLTAERGDFNKADGKVHLEENVVITTSKGAKLTTDSLDWDRKAGLVTTDDMVNIQSENMVAIASGASTEPNLKKVALEKDVRLDINSASPDKAQGAKEKIIITCDGPLEIDYDKNIAKLNNNVKVERFDSTIYSDKMEVFFNTKNVAASDKSSGIMNSKIDKIIARGNVRVVQGENISYSEEAIYTAIDKKIILSGRPKLIINSAEEFNDASFGN